MRVQSDIDKERIAARIKEISAQGGKVVSYIDCGLQVHSNAKAVSIKQLNGKGWTYKGSDGVEIAKCHKDIAFDERDIVYSVSGLKSGAEYKLNLTWWDFNNGGRRQSIFLSGPRGRGKKLVRKTAPLPAYLARNQLPETVTVDLPASFLRQGKIEVYIHCDGGANAVVGELWVTQE